MNVLLINPSIEIDKNDFLGIAPPMGILYIASSLEKAGHNVKVIDCMALGSISPIIVNRNGKEKKFFGISDDFLSNIIKDFKPQMVGLSNNLINNQKECLHIAEVVKFTNSSIKVAVGGVNATTHPLFFLKHNCVDYVFLGEGEETIRILVERIEKNQSVSDIDGFCYNQDGKPFMNPKTKYIEDLDSLPFPAWHLVNMELYFTGRNPLASIQLHKRMASVITSRGCINDCWFCSGKKYLGKWRARSPDNVVEEIKELVKLYDVKEIQFDEANICVVPKRLVSICELLIKENIKVSWVPMGGMYVNTFSPDMVKLLKKSGCYYIPFGIEHGDPSMQKKIGKMVSLDKLKKIVAECKKEGIWTHGLFILGLPGETLDSARSTLEFAKESDLDSVSFFNAIPLPGSRLYEEFKDKLNLDQLKDDDFKLISKTVSVSDFSGEELDRLRRDFLKEFLLYRIRKDISPNRVLMRLKSIRGISDVRFYYLLLKRFVQLVFGR